MKKFVRAVCLLSIILIPFIAIGLDVVYLYVHFTGCYETWWA